MNSTKAPNLTMSHNRITKPIDWTTHHSDGATPSSHPSYTGSTSNDPSPFLISSSSKQALHLSAHRQNASLSHYILVSKRRILYVLCNIDYIVENLSTKGHRVQYRLLRKHFSPPVIKHSSHLTLIQCIHPISFLNQIFYFRCRLITHGNVFYTAVLIESDCESKKLHWLYHFTRTAPCNIP